MVSGQVGAGDANAGEAGEVKGGARGEKVHGCPSVRVSTAEIAWGVRKLDAVELACGRRTKAPS